MPRKPRKAGQPTVKVHVYRLRRRALDYVVGLLVGLKVEIKQEPDGELHIRYPNPDRDANMAQLIGDWVNWNGYSPSRMWKEGMTVLISKGVSMIYHANEGGTPFWEGQRKVGKEVYSETGHHPITAGLRAYVHSLCGETVEIPAILEGECDAER